MLEELKADIARYPGGGARSLSLALRSASFYPIAVYRFGRDVYFRWPRPLSIAARVPYKLAAFFTELATGIAIAPDASIGPGLYIGHWGCIRIASQVRIGERCNLSPMVILGFGAREGRTGVPSLGDRVYIAAGAKVVGPIRVGSDSAVGANAVVCRDVPDHVTVGGVPARVISTAGSAPYLQVGQPLDVMPAEHDEEAEEVAVRDADEPEGSRDAG